MAKGLAARLQGPAVDEAPVTVFCSIYTQNRNQQMDLSDIGDELPNVVRQSVSAILFFCVFYNDRVTSISNFYLAQGYRYTDGNSQVKKFIINDNMYEADYPVGWGIGKAFSYLRREIN